MQLADRVQRIQLSPTAAVMAEAERMAADGVDVINFGVGEPDFPTPEHIKQAAIEALAANRTRYTSTAGIYPLREAVCHWHAREFGTRYQPSECVITVGGKQALFNALSALVNPGDEVLLPAPYWVSYPDMLRHVGAELHVLPTVAEHGFRLQAKQVEAAIGPKTRGLIVNSPNNPTGAVVAERDFGELLVVCRRHGLWLLTDECYSHFLYDGQQPFSVASLPEARDHVIVAGSLSKTFAMTGWRIGFALGPRPVIDAMVRLQSQSTSNATSIAQYAALRALTGPMDSVRAMQTEYDGRRRLILAALAQIPGLSCTPPQGAFYVFPDVRQTPRMISRPSSTAELAVELLREERVAVVAGEAFGAPGHLRISYATSTDRIREGVRRLSRFLAAC